jgi:hypothetical protein
MTEPTETKMGRVRGDTKMFLKPRLIDRLKMDKALTKLNPGEIRSLQSLSRIFASTRELTLDSTDDMESPLNDPLLE